MNVVHFNFSSIFRGDTFVDMKIREKAELCVIYLMPRKLVWDTVLSIKFRLPRKNNCARPYMQCNAIN